MNKWKTGFFTLLLIALFLLLKLQIRNAFDTIDKSLISTYTLVDLNFINKILPIKETDLKLSALEIINQDSNYNYITISNDTINLRTYDIILDDKNTLLEIKHKDSHFIKAN